MLPSFRVAVILSPALTFLLLVITFDGLDCVSEPFLMMAYPLPNVASGLAV